NLEQAVLKVLAQLKGLFAFVAVSADDPQKIVAVREGAPIIVGSVDGEGFVASDIPAVLPYTRSILFLDEHEVAVVGGDGIRLFDSAGKERKPQFQQITWDPIMAEKGGYKLFIFITQSGETADTVAAQRQVRESGAKILTLTNVVGSMTTRVADAVLYTRAGPEIGVASTKAFTTQLACLYLVALHLSKLHA